MNNITNNMLIFLRVLTADGRLSGEEVWLLADYLNNNKAASEIWPGNLLVPVLQRVFHDGVLSEEEMMEVGLLICNIEHQAANLKSEAEFQDGPPPIVIDQPSYLPESTHPDQSNDLFLPMVEWTGYVKSSDGETDYYVDLVKFQCTCPDWAGCRSKLMPNSIGRACKHIVRSLHDQGVFDNLSPINRAILNDAFFRNGGTAPCDEYIQMDINGKSVLISYTGGEWANILAPDGKDYSRYGYNIMERRWSYGEAPKGARKIKEYIHNKFNINIE